MKPEGKTTATWRWVPRFVLKPCLPPACNTTKRTESQHPEQKVFSSDPQRIRRRLRAGLSLVEVMMATVIAATLLTATAAAWVASTNAVEINDRTGRALQSASVSLLQITNAIRRCQAVQTYSDHIDLLTFDNHNYSYYYVPSSQQLQFVDKDVTPNTTYPMAGNVTAVTITCDTAPNPQTQVSCVVHVSITATVTINNCSFTLAAGAAPRCNINY